MKNMNTTYADRVSLYVPGDTQLYIPKEERERREQERQEKSDLVFRFLKRRLISVAAVLQ